MATTTRGNRLVKPGGKKSISMESLTSMHYSDESTASPTATPDSTPVSSPQVATKKKPCITSSYDGGGGGGRRRTSSVKMLAANFDKSTTTSPPPSFAVGAPSSPFKSPKKAGGSSSCALKSSNKQQQLTPNSALNFLSPRPNGRRTSVTFQSIPDLHLLDDPKYERTLSSSSPTRQSSSSSTFQMPVLKKTTPISRPRKNCSTLLAAGTHSDAFQPFWKDKVLNKSRLVRKRLFGAATKIQALFRGFIQRKEHVKRKLLHVRHVNATKIQTLLRGWMQQSKYQRMHQRHTASVCIQAFYRGYTSRLKVQLLQLVRRFETAQRYRADGLIVIEQWKQQELQSIHGLIEENVDVYCQTRARGRLNMEIVSELKRQQEESLQELEQLTRDCEHYEQENARLMTELAIRTDQSSKIRLVLTSVQRDYTKWQHTHDKYEDRLSEYRDNLDLRETKFHLERTIRRNYERLIASVTKHVQLNDLELFFDLESTGLLETVHDKFARRRTTEQGHGGKHYPPVVRANS